MDLGPVGYQALLLGEFLARGEEQGFQLGILERVGQRPTQSGLGGSVEVAAHGSGTNTTTGGDVAVGQTALPFESEHFTDGSHGQSPSGHGALLGKEA